MKDYYDTLGIPENASSEQIKKAFKDIAKKEHPDRGGDEAKFKEANEAYDTLKDSQKRHDYDTMRKYGSSMHGDQFSFRTNDMGDMFESFFSGFGNGDMNFTGPGNININRRRRFQKNQSINVRMALSLKEILTQSEKTISYKLPSGREEFANVKIPAGVGNGVTFKYKGLGDDSIKELPRGDLMVQITVLDCDGYERKDNDLHTTKTISCFDAIRGCDIELRELNGNVVKVRVPPGTQPGTLLNVSNRGLPVHNALNINGNLYIKVHVIVPRLSEADLKKIKDL